MRKALVLLLIGIFVLGAVNSVVRADSGVNVSTLTLAGYEVRFYDNPTRNDLLILWLHGGLAFLYSDHLQDYVVGPASAFQDGDAQALAEAGFDVLQPVGYDMHWSDTGSWVLSIIDAFGPSVRGYTTVILAGYSAGATVVGNVITHHSQEAASRFSAAILVSGVLAHEPAGVFDSANYAYNVTMSRVWLIHGNSDTVTSPAESQRFFTNMPSTVSKQLILLVGLTHFDVMQTAVGVIVNLIIQPARPTSLGLQLSTDIVNATNGESLTLILYAYLQPGFLPLGNVPVEIQYRRVGTSDWLPLYQGYTTDNGRLNVDYAPIVTDGSYSLEFQAIYRGNATLQGSVSQIVSVQVVPEFSSAILMVMLSVVLLGSILMINRRRLAK